MTAPVTEDAPVDTGDDDLDHAACAHRDVTWCGLDASQMPWLASLPGSIENVCRVCLLAVEMHQPGSPCPICGCWDCLE